MNKTLRTKSSNNRIIGFLVIIGLFVFSMSGCQQVNDLVNGNKAANTNTTANSNTKTNANANANTNSNANANTSVVPSNSAANNNNQASNTNANTAAATKEEVPLTPEAKVFKNNLVGKWTYQVVTFTFTEDKIESSKGEAWTYRVLDEKTVEFRQGQQRPTKAKMSFEDDGNTLIWEEESGGKLKLTRVKPN